ncbi:MAG: hypothetical protein ABFS41_14650 [Myxococcota bacterium]
MKPDAIRDKVAVLGVGCCRFGENWEHGQEFDPGADRTRSGAP